MVDLIESSGGASSCPEGLGSRCCKEGHITYITHSLARDPQVEFRVGVRRKVEENGNTNTNHAVELDLNVVNIEKRIEIESACSS